MFNFIKSISSTELIIIIVIILIVLFGAKAVAGLGRKSGEVAKEVKKIKKDLTDAMEDTEVKKDDDEKPSKS